MPKVAVALGRPYSTVRDWRRRHRERTGELVAGLAGRVVEVGGDVPKLSGEVERTALALLAVARTATTRRLRRMTGGLYVHDVGHRREVAGQDHEPALERRRRAAWMLRNDEPRLLSRHGPTRARADRAVPLPADRRSPQPPAATARAGTAGAQDGQRQHEFPDGSVGTVRRRPDEAHMARMITMASSRAARLSAGVRAGAPIECAASRKPPLPVPSSKRPPLSTSSVDAALASIAGGRSGRSWTSAKTRTVSVCERIHPMSASVSKKRDWY